MSTFDGNNHYYSGQGVVMIGDRDPVTGRATGLIPVGNVSDLKISIQTSTIEHKESQTGQRGIDLRLTTETKASLSMTMENFIAANLATALRGARTSVAGGTLTETFTVVPGGVANLQRMKISAVTVTGAGTLFVDDITTPTWGHKINYEAGSVLVRDTTASDEDGFVAVTVAYTYAEQLQVDALTTGAQEKYLRFEGLNTADNNAPVVIEVFKFSVDPLKELSMISDSIQQFVLEGNALADPLRTTGSKYFKELTLR